MLPDYEEFKRRADAVRARIEAACARAGRNAGDVELLAVTKSHPAAAAELAARYGLRAVGENRVQEGVDKRAQTTAAVAWELIGHLQSNKARLAARHFERIQSVDSAKLLDILDRAAGELGKTQAVLLQVNAGLDPAKSGVEPDQAPALLAAALVRKNIRVEGLMTIAPLSADPDAARRTFARLREIRDRLAADSGSRLRELSMGMTGDMDAAVAEGSTIVRVGTALFGPRA
ncbi:MAG TPA: YggS family pyridoxal phosphate-dependent enzyme [Opitutaceae bacterium]|nr:YggS family pyridoxal phosphate-dependent enzyme [Opitutaceae bacterium]